jgi:MSHA biogenesis protein MshJ
MSVVLATQPTGRADPKASLARAATAGRMLVRRFHQRNQRERLILITACVALAGMLADQLWLGPALKDWQAARAALAAVRQQQETVQTDIEQRQARMAATARQHQADLTLWRQRLKDGDEALRRHADALVGPDRMLDLLDKLLARHGEVRVRGLRSLGRSDVLNPGSSAALAASRPATPATAAASTAGTAPLQAAPAPAGGLYRHGVELQLEGSYADLLAYLQAMEGLPQRMLWGSASLQVEQHPRCVLTLRVHTLSRDPHWLEL